MPNLHYSLLLLNLYFVILVSDLECSIMNLYYCCFTSVLSFFILVGCCSIVACLGSWRFLGVWILIIIRIFMGILFSMPSNKTILINFLHYLIYLWFPYHTTTNPEPPSKQSQWIKSKVHFSSYSKFSKYHFLQYITKFHQD